jgi:acetyl-CoA C-acetyltransferase
LSDRWQAVKARFNALRECNKRYGLQTMCEGGGMANVTIVERL